MPARSQPPSSRLYRRPAGVRTTVIAAPRIGQAPPSSVCQYFTRRHASGRTRSPRPGGSLTQWCSRSPSLERTQLNPTPPPRYGSPQGGLNVFSRGAAPLTLPFLNYASETLGFCKAGRDRCQPYCSVAHQRWATRHSLIQQRRLKPAGYTINETAVNNRARIGAAPRMVTSDVGIDAPADRVTLRATRGCGPGPAAPPQDRRCP